MNKISFAIHTLNTDCIEASIDDKIHVSFDCQKYNAQVQLNELSNIAFLTCLAREEHGLYAKLAVRGGGLQGYVERLLGKFNIKLLSC